MAARENSLHVFIITTLHALFIRSATIETNNDHFALITRCVREECNTNRIMIVTCDWSSTTEAKQTGKKRNLYKWRLLSE